MSSHPVDMLKALRTAPHEPEPIPVPATVSVNTPEFVKLVELATREVLRGEVAYDVATVRMLSRQHDRKVFRRFVCRGQPTKVCAASVVRREDGRVFIAGLGAF